MTGGAQTTSIAFARAQQERDLGPDERAALKGAQRAARTLIGEEHIALIASRPPNLLQNSVGRRVKSAKRNPLAPPLDETCSTPRCYDA